MAPSPAPRTVSPHSGRSRSRLALAAALSVGAHLAALAAFVSAGASGGAPPGALELAEPLDPETPREPDVPLGSERPTATTITWIGSDALERHVDVTAAPVDQPELSMDDPAGPPLQVAAVPVPTAAPTEPVEVQPEPFEHARPPVELPLAAAEPYEETEPEQARVVAQPAVPALVDEEFDVAQGDWAIEPFIGPVPPETSDVPELTEVEPLELPRPAPEAEPSPPEKSPPPSPNTASRPQIAAAGAGGTGTKSDRESDAASTVTAKVRDLGQPLISQGLEIRTVRPRFTYYTQLTASPRPPVVRVQFDREGRVYRAEYVQSSGVSDVDRPLLDAIYEWRARGKQLEGLSNGNPPETVTIQIRILL